MSWSSQKKKDGIFIPFIVSKEMLLIFVFYLNENSVSNKLSEYTYFYISKNVTSYTFLLVFKIDGSVRWSHQRSHQGTLAKSEILSWFSIKILCMESKRRKIKK